MDIDRDEWKRAENLKKHGFDFADCAAVFEGYTVTTEDLTTPAPERRYRTLGMLDERVVSIVHTESSNRVRIISLRRATRRECEIYFKALKGLLD